jgi:hypothetical protein
MTKIILNGVMTFAKNEVDVFTNIWPIYFRQVGENALRKPVKVYCIPVIRNFV